MLNTLTLFYENYIDIANDVDALREHIGKLENLSFCTSVENEQVRFLLTDILNLNACAPSTEGIVQVVVGGIRTLIAKLISVLEKIIYFIKHIGIIALHKCYKLFAHRSKVFNEQYKALGTDVAAIYIHKKMEKFVLGGAADMKELLFQGSNAELDEHIAFMKELRQNNSPNESTLRSEYRRCTMDDVNVYCERFNQTTDTAIDLLTEYWRKIDKRRIQLDFETMRSQSEKVVERIPNLREEIDLMKIRLQYIRAIVGMFPICIHAVKIITVDGTIK